MDPANEQEEMVEIDLREMINIFLERWYIIVGLTVIAGIAAGIFSFMQDPIYESSTQVLVEEQDPAMEGDSFFPMALDSGSENMANRLHIISSPLVLDKARELLLEEGNEEYATYLEEKREKIVQVNNQGDTDIIEIKVTARTPQEAKALASSIAFAYQNYREDRAQEQSRRVVSFLEEQVDQAEAETKRAEEEVRDYQKQEGVISLNDEASKLNDQLTELETRRVTADIKIQEQEMRLEQVNENLTELKDQLPEESTIVTESLVENLREQLSELEAERIDYLNRGLAESSPEIESLDRRINNLEQSIREYTREVTARPDPRGRMKGLITIISYLPKEHLWRLK
ncbi:MAG: GumC family protein [Halanaerobiaceae bacterium]